MPVFDKVCLGIDGTSLEQVLDLAREFRACTRTIKIGTAFYTVHGPLGVRRLVEAGIRRIILDIQMAGSGKAMSEAVTAVVALGGIVGITTQMCNDPRAIKAAVFAAGTRLSLLGSPLASQAAMQQLPAWLSPQCSWPEYLRSAAGMATDIGLSGLTVSYHDFQTLKAQFPHLRYLVTWPYRLQDHTEIPKSGQPHLGQAVQDGAVIVIRAEDLAGRDLSWSADLLMQCLGGTAGRHRRSRN